MIPLTTSTTARVRQNASGLLAAALLSAVALVAGLADAGAQEDAARPPAVRSEADYAGLVAAVLDAHVRPAYERFGRDAELLASEVDALCAAPADAALADARRAFEASARSYLALVPVRFGPILEANRQERLAFWPDPRGIGLKQVQAILAKQDAAALDPAALAGKSVGVQGLTALEFLLYGTGAETLAAATPDGVFRCGYADAITANLSTIAGELVAAWEEGGPATTLWTEPGPANPLFQTHKEAAGKIFNTVAAGLEVVAETMLDAPFGDAEDRAKPKLAAFWRSGQSMPGVAAVLEATQHLVEVSGVTAMLDPREAWLGNSVLFELRNGAANARAITAPMEKAVADRKARDAARYLLVATHSLKRAIGRELTAAIGLEQGFNANDGD